MLRRRGGAEEDSALTLWYPHFHYVERWTVVTHSAHRHVCACGGWGGAPGRQRHEITWRRGAGGKLED